MCGTSSSDGKKGTITDDDLLSGRDGEGLR
jgi:hypothetical protein